MKEPFVPNFTDVLCAFCGQILWFKRLDSDRLEFHHSTVEFLLDWDIPIQFCPNNARVFEFDTRTMTRKDIPFYMAKYV